MGPDHHRGPDFLGIGSSRCGPSTLHNALRRQPQLWLPPIKELHYWDKQRGAPRRNPAVQNRHRHLARSLLDLRARRPGASRDLAFLARYWTQARSDQWYDRLFDSGGGRLSGEITPAYCTLDDAVVPQIAARYPELRVVLLVRDPLDRAVSVAAKSLARPNGVQTSELDDDDLEALFESPGFRSRADYVRAIDIWSSHLGESQVLVAFFDELTGDREAFAHRLGSFLGVDEQALAAALAAQPVVNSTAGHRDRLPDAWERRLAADQLEMVTELADSHGGPAERWRDRLAALANAAA